MTPALQAIRQAIQDQITTNHNGEITGAILNPILVGMITALVDSIGDIEALDTVDKENTVRAINELNGLIQDLEPIKKFTGTEDPNDSPPAGATLGDLYFQMNGGVVIDVWQFIEIRWVSLDTSSFVRRDKSNTVTPLFAIKSGDTELYFDGEYFNIKVLDSHLYTFREDGLTYSDAFGNEVNLNIEGVSGNGNNVLWYVRKHTDDAENSFLILPQSSTEQRLAISVNNQFADEFGNIEIEVDENAVTYDLQEPTPEQQANARENIGVTTSLYKQSFLNYEKNTNPDAEFTLDFVPSQVVFLVINNDRILHAEIDDYKIEGDLLTILTTLDESDNIFITYYH